MNKIIDSKNLKKWSMLAILVFTITKVLSLLPPLIMQKVIDVYIPNQDIRGIIFGIILFVTIPAVYILSQILFNYFSIKFARNKGNDIAMQITKNLVDQDLEFFDRQNSVELVTNSSKEATGYINFYISELPMYYGYIFISATILIILCTYSPYIALVNFYLYHLPSGL